MSSDTPIPLNAFLKILSTSKLSTAQAMRIAGKMRVKYKKCNTPKTLGFLTDAQLDELGVESKEERKLVLAAVRKAGYKSAPPKKPAKGAEQASSSTVEPSPNTSPQKKRKREDTNDMLPDRDASEGEAHGSLEFNEVLDEEILKTKSTLVNRAPLMTAWAFVVAERMGFKREEALSIASVYAEMNAISKGVSLGIYDKNKEKVLEAEIGGSQPYIDIMGRRILFKTGADEWRGMSNGKPVSPATAFGYIQRSLRQTTPYVVGALRLVADSYTPDELNQRGFAIYADIRPDVKGWGERGKLSCESILAARKQPNAITDTNHSTVDQGVKVEDAQEPQEPEKKKVKTEDGLVKDEYDAALEDDTLSFEDFASAELP